MHRIFALVILCVAILGSAVAGPVRSEAQPVFVPMVINRPEPTLAPPAISITDLHYTGRDEWVQVTNTADQAVSIEGYRLQSVEGDQWYDLPDLFMPPGTSLRIHSGPDAIDNPPSDVLWTTQYIWNNDGDEARLYDEEGVLIDQWIYD